MKVKIVKAKLKTYWYAEHIGDVFDVKSEDSVDWRLLVEDSTRFIGKEDCVIVGECGLELPEPEQQFRIMRQKKPGKKYKTRGTILHSVDEAKNLLAQLQDNFPQYKYILVEIIEGDMDV